MGSDVHFRKEAGSPDRIWRLFVSSHVKVWAAYKNGGFFAQNAAAPALQLAPTVTSPTTSFAHLSQWQEDPQLAAPALAPTATRTNLLVFS